MGVVHCNRECDIRTNLDTKVKKLESILKVNEASSKAQTILIVHAHRREEDLKLKIKRLKLWKM